MVGSRKKSAGKASAKKGASKRLSARQEKFVEGVLQHGNGAKAARDAGYSPKRARVTAHELTVTNRNIQERIKERQVEAKVETDEVIGTLVSHMRADVGDILPNNPIVKAAKKVGKSHLIKKLVIKKYWDKSKGAEVEETTFELHGSQSAASKLCEVFGLNKEPAKNPEEAARAAYERLTREFEDIPAEVIAQRVAKQFGVEESVLIH